MNMTALELYAVDTRIHIKIKIRIKEWVTDIMNYFSEGFNDSYYLIIEKWLIAKKLLDEERLKQFKWTIMTYHPRQFKTSPGIHELENYYEIFTAEIERENNTKAIKDTSRLIGEEIVTAEQVHEAMEGITKAWKLKEKT